jgi:membrane protein
MPEHRNLKTTQHSCAIVVINHKFSAASLKLFMVKKVQSIWVPRIFMKLVRDSFGRLQQHNPLQMAGATAFFTSFALPPIIILLFQVLSIFISKRRIGSRMGEVLSATVGTEGARQLGQTAKAFRNLAQNWYMAVIGSLFLLFVATTLFKVVRNSLNDIWNIQLERSGFINDLKGRGRSLLIILAAAILFMVSIMMDVIKAITGEYIGKLWEEGKVFYTSSLNEIASALFVITWFIVLFRYLGNGRPNWRVSIAGGILTGILFSLGKTLLSTVMKNSNIGIIYGASGAIVVILLFVFYSSFILYFGASFIKEYSSLRGEKIIPSKGAFQYELRKIPAGKS